MTRVAREVGTEGKLGGQAVVPGVAGTWKDLTDSVNAMAGNLTARCATSRTSPPPWRAATCRARSPWTSSGEILRAEGDHQHDGRPAERLRGEVTRVAREVGTEGKLGGQAQVPAWPAYGRT